MSPARRARERLSAALRGDFLRDVLKLAFGTVFGRAISLAALPVVTRLYTPEDFSLLAVYLSTVSLVAVVSCLRLEVAIPLADDDADAANLLALALIALTLITALALGLTTFLPENLAGWLGTPGIAPYLWLVPLGVALAGTYSAFQLWATRVRRFGWIAQTRVGQALVGVFTMLSLGWAGIAPLGLLLGNMLNTGAGGFSLGIQALRSDRFRSRLVSAQRMKKALLKYYKYPVYSTPEALLNKAGIQVPILLIAAYAGTEAGFMFLAIQIMSAPMTLLGNSVSQVYSSRATDALQDGTLYQLTSNVMRRALTLGIGPIVVIGLLAPFLVPYVFGAEWSRSGAIISWLAPSILMQFIASPVSMVMMVTGRQKQLLIIRVFTLILRVGAVFMAVAMSNKQFIVEFFAIANAAVYAMLGLIFLHSAKASLHVKVN